MAGEANRVDVSVVLPVNNEVGHLSDEVKRIRNSLDTSDYSYEIIVVDDGSTDGSAEVAAKLDNVKLMRFATNRGAGSARKYGTMAARGDVVVWTDVDMTDSIKVAIESNFPRVQMKSAQTLEALKEWSMAELKASGLTDLRAVRESSMCIACGACVHADPSVKLELNPTKQMWEPSSNGNALAAAVCPAVQVDFEGLQRLLFPGSDPGPYGAVDSVMLAQSTNVERNLNVRSGGG